MRKGFLIRIMSFMFCLLFLLCTGIICSYGSESEVSDNDLQTSRIKSVAAFMNNTAVLKEDGSVWGWGDNSSGILGAGEEDGGNIVFEPVKIDGLEDISSISMGNGYLLALKHDGTVWGLGYNTQGIIDADKGERIIRKPVRIKNLSDVKAISAGINYAMALRSDGTVYIWGNYRYKVSENRLHGPLEVKQVSNIKGINASKYNAFIIDSEDKAWFCRGYLHKAVEITNKEDVRCITESNSRTYAITNDGSLWYWSINGQYVHKLDSVENVKQVMAYGVDMAVALDSSGNVWKWNEKDMLPVRLTNIEGVKEISAGNSHIAALKEDGTLWTWGDNSFGQLGNGGGFFEKEPQEVNSLERIEKVSASRTFAAALNKDGTVWTWGSNEHGQLGDSTREDRSLPVKVEGIEEVKEISVGYSHMLALKSDGTVWTWGSNGSGELGDGSFEDKLTPVKVDGLDKVVSVSAGKGYSMALKSNGTVWVWGSSSYQPERRKKERDISIPVRVEELNSIAQIEAGYECTAAVSRSGIVWGWGNNFNGQLGYMPKEENNIREKPRVIGGSSYTRSVSIGSAHVLVLSMDKKVKAWGKNNMGQLGADNLLRFYSAREIEELTDIVYVAAGGSCSYAKRSDGTVLVWGDNTYGQLGPDLGSVVKTPAQVDFLWGAKQISAGDRYTIAVKEDGTVFAWGDNTYGQLGIGKKSSSYFEKPVMVTLP